MSNPARFLSRWSRLKQRAVVEETAPAVVSPAIPASAGEVVEVSEAGEVSAGASLLPGFTGDVTALLREELSDTVRKQALKSIFADPHFNVMDGLDTYIDDYSISEGISPEMLATLNQARCLFESDEQENAGAPAKLPPRVTADEDDGDNLGHAGQKVPASDVELSISKDK